MRVFDHVGIPADERHPEEMYVPETKVWVTDPARHPYRVEYLRFEPDSPVTNEVRRLPHIAFRVDRLEGEIEGERVVLGPFQATPDLRVVFIVKDGAVFEFMESTQPGHWFRKT
jgi:hypothetical protein